MNLENQQINTDSYNIQFIPSSSEPVNSWNQQINKVKKSTVYIFFLDSLNKSLQKKVKFNISTNQQQFAQVYALFSQILKIFLENMLKKQENQHIISIWNHTVMFLFG